jgi:prophage regulatory protein
MKKSTTVIGRKPQNRTLARSDFPELEELIRNCRNLVNVRVLRLQQVKEKLGLAHSTIWKSAKDGTLPKPIAIGDKSVGWLESEIDAVIHARRFESRSGNIVDFKAFVTSLVTHKDL